MPKRKKDFTDEEIREIGDTLPVGGWDPQDMPPSDTVTNKYGHRESAANFVINQKAGQWRRDNHRSFQESLAYAKNLKRERDAKRIKQLSSTQGATPQELYRAHRDDPGSVYNQGQLFIQPQLRENIRQSRLQRAEKEEEAVRLGPRRKNAPNKVRSSQKAEL